MLELEALKRFKQIYMVVHQVARHTTVYDDYDVRQYTYHQRIKERLILQRMSEEEAEASVALYRAVGFDLHFKIVSENPCVEWFNLFTEQVWTALYDVDPVALQLRVLYS